MMSLARSSNETRQSKSSLPVCLIAFLLTLSPVIAESGTVADDLLTLHNEYRQQNGSPALCMNQKLLTDAENFCQYMATTGDFSHYSKNGATPASRLAAVGYQWYTYGENIAWGQTTPEQVMADWEASPGHHQNIVNPTFKEAGFAKCGSDYQPIWVAVFGASRVTNCMTSSSGGTAAATPPPSTNSKPDPLLAVYNSCPNYSKGWTYFPDKNLYYIFWNNGCYQFNGNTGIMYLLVKNSTGKITLQTVH